MLLNERQNSFSGRNAHTLSVSEVLRYLESDASTGLTKDDARHRLLKYGPNALQEGAGRPLWRIILEQFTDFMILVLIGAAVISSVIGDLKDAMAIVVIVLLNAIIGSIQEYRAERAMAALRKLSSPTVRVLRACEYVDVASVRLVPGDIVLLEAGQIIPADLRLIDVAGMQVDESALTGESVSVSKHTAALDTSAHVIGERQNMVYKGTQISSGRGSGVVVATGMHTELGRIADLISGADSLKTPLQQRLARFGRRLALAILAICVVIFVTGVLRGEALVLMFLTAVSLAVAAIPEALPAVVTIALAFGARGMSRLQALIRHLPAVETLGSVTYICSDKTGTLTENAMHLERLIVAGDECSVLKPAKEGVLWRTLGQALALNNDVVSSEGGQDVHGDPTEVALFLAAESAGYDKRALHIRHPRIDELPFDSTRKMMSTMHSADKGIILYSKGAPEQLLPRCRHVMLGDGSIGDIDTHSQLAAAERLASEGFRVLAIACRTFESPVSERQSIAVEDELTLLGLVAMIDPPREGAANAVTECRAAGITPVMITGDHPGTALAIARRLGIAKSADEVLTGEELLALSPHQLAGRVEDIRVYARVSPEQKIRIVRALQEKGEFVAMTGDGVNDAPSLKQADIGIAMGLKGTDVAREAADMVLLDDNFTTIVSAVRAGRRIFDNIRKFIKDTMSSNSGEIWTLFLAPFLGLPVPLLPIHILWINLVTDGLPGLAFTAEPAERGIMRRPPRPPKESIFAHGMWQHIVWVGLFVGGITLAAQAWALSRGIEHWQTIVFTVLTISQLFHSMAVRSERQSLFSIGLLSNLYMLGAVLLTVALQLMVIYLPAFNPIFHTQPLPLFDLSVCFALSSLVLVGVELEKWLVRRGLIYQG